MSEMLIYDLLCHLGWYGTKSVVTLVDLTFIKVNNGDFKVSSCVENY